MKFDFVIGNPPYQDESHRSNGYAAPVYHSFIDAAYSVGESVELIHPARFLFNAGSTPKEWNQKMLNDCHLKVLYYDADSSMVFAGVEIKGGIAVTLHDKNHDFGAIETFTPMPELNTILAKIKRVITSSISDVAFVTAKFNFEMLFVDHPECRDLLKERRLATNVLEILDGIISFSTIPNNGCEYVKVYGRIKNDRVYRYIARKYIDVPKNLDKYKVFLPKVSGNGTFGEIITDPIIGRPCEINTHTFMSIGLLSTEFEGNALLKYVKSKFVRTLLGILKITQHNSNECWRYVPLQDFTPSSDIDWTEPIPQIDRQLYRKYGLTEEEIAFIETNVKEMT
ncbi:MAG: Eco57I restriction-modification methylase domain-containing protein [Clostridia bacterium]|nr:Eco57I restriction-modification methylase domain-containing protein [Clostridia bacterium]